MTPDEIRAEEQKRQAFKGWANGFYDRLRYGAGGHFNNEGQYVRYPQGMQVTSVQRLPQQGDAPPMQRPTPQNPAPQPTGPSTQSLGPTPEQVRQTYEAAGIGTIDPNRPTPQNPAPAPSGPPTQNIPPPPDTTTVAPPESGSPAPAPTSQGSQEEGQESRSNNRANDTFRRYMKLFATNRRSE